MPRPATFDALSLFMSGASVAEITRRLRQSGYSVSPDAVRRLIELEGELLGVDVKKKEVNHGK